MHTLLQCPHMTPCVAVPAVQIGLVSRFQPSHPDGFQLAVSICAITIILTGITMVRSRVRGQNPSVLEELNCSTVQSGCGHSLGSILY